jgi:hypothetical protein
LNQQANSTEKEFGLQAKSQGSYYEILNGIDNITDPQTAYFLGVIVTSSGGVASQHLDIPRVLQLSWIWQKVCISVNIHCK